MTEDYKKGYKQLRKTEKARNTCEHVWKRGKGFVGAQRHRQRGAVSILKTWRMDGSGQEEKQQDQLGLFAVVLVRDDVCMKGQRVEGKEMGW